MKSLMSWERTPSGDVIFRVARNREYEPRSPLYEATVLCDRPRSTDRWSRYSSITFSMAVVPPGSAAAFVAFTVAAFRFEQEAYPLALGVLSAPQDQIDLTSLYFDQSTLHIGPAAGVPSE